MQQAEDLNAAIRLPKEQSSYWLDASPASQFPALAENIACDVAIVGGGIAGLTAAYKLKRAGLKVAVVEKNTVASGTTGGTTGKVTVQHGLTYAELLERFGGKFTRQYADVCQQAFNDLEVLIADENIDCDWHRADNFVYTTEQKRVTAFKQEAAIAADMGLPASYETSSSLPFAIKGAVKFADQAYFNAVKYVRALARLVNSGGSYVFEHSEAVKIHERSHEGQPCKMATKGGEITAPHLIIATKVPAAPLVGRFTYATREYPTTSYLVAGKYAGDLEGMYISPDKSHYSLLPVAGTGSTLLLAGGESHLPGIKKPMPRYEKLAAYLQKWFGVTEVAYRWKAMDYIAYDSLPLVGPLYPWSKRAYMIGGFKKWGLNLSMVAANILLELITGARGRNVELFSPHRLSAPASIPRAVVKYFQ